MVINAILVQSTKIYFDFDFFPIIFIRDFLSTQNYLALLYIRINYYVRDFPPNNSFPLLEKEVGKKMSRISYFQFQLAWVVNFLLIKLLYCWTWARFEKIPKWISLYCAKCATRWYAFKISSRLYSIIIIKNKDFSITNYVAQQILDTHQKSPSIPAKKWKVDKVLWKKKLYEISLDEFYSSWVENFFSFSKNYGWISGRRKREKFFRKGKCSQETYPYKKDVCQFLENIDT